MINYPRFAFLRSAWKAEAERLIMESRRSPNAGTPLPKMQVNPHELLELINAEEEHALVWKTEPPSCKCGAEYPQGIKTSPQGWLYGHKNHPEEWQ